MMCARLLRNRKEGKEEHHGQLYQASEKGFAWLLERYQNSLQVVLRHPAITLIVLIAVILANIVLFIKIPHGLFPEQDNGTIFGGIQGSQDASYQSMQVATERFVRIATNDPAVANAMAFTGGNGAGGGSIYVGLKPLAQRKSAPSRSSTAFVPNSPRLPAQPFLYNPARICVLVAAQSLAQYQYTLQSADLDDLVKWGPILHTQVQKLPGFTDVNSDQQNSGLQASLTYDRNTAARLGISAQTLDNTIYDAFGQEDVSTMYSALNQYHVVMEVQPQFLQNPQALNTIYLHSTNSTAMIPLSAVARYQPTTAPLAVNHTGQFPSVTLSFNLAPGVALGDAVNEIAQMEQRLKMPTTIHGNFAGTAAAYQSSLASEPYLILTALLAVYIVLGILYESYIHPITILSTLPSAGVGAVVALMIFNTELSIIALIGVILLIGIVKKNAILMIDFAITAERDQHLAPATPSIRRASSASAPFS